MPTRSRKLVPLLILGLAALLALGWWHAMAAPIVPEPGLDESGQATSPPEAQGTSGELAVGTVLPAQGAGGDRQALADTSHWTSGVIRGDLSLATNTLDRIGSLMIVLEEQRNSTRPDGTAAYHRVVPVQFDGKSTPTFEVRNVPFSSYPYLVTLYAPGLNGSNRTVSIDRDHPLADDVLLRLSAPGPLTLLLRDQDGLPYPALQVRLSPVGAPLGRPRLDATADSYGCAQWEQVLAGEYRALVMQSNEPIGPEHQVIVQPDARMYQSTLQAHGQTLVIPRGQALEVHVVDARGYGIPEVSVKAQATERTKLTEFCANTDQTGIARFPHLVPGVWQLDVHKDAYQPRAQQLRLVDRQPPDIVQVQLVRLR